VATIPWRFTYLCWNIPGLDRNLSALHPSICRRASSGAVPCRPIPSRYWRSWRTMRRSAIGTTRQPTMQIEWGARNLLQPAVTELVRTQWTCRASPPMTRIELHRAFRLASRALIFGPHFRSGHRRHTYIDRIPNPTMLKHPLFLRALL
jgi:hypothetical protein